MKTSIFIRTYIGDYVWLTYCLEGLRKHAQGFEEIVIATPDYKKIRNNVDVRGCRLTECPALHQDDYIGQQITKISADRYCPGADFILHVDSDCFAIADFGPAGFFSEGGKPIATFRDWEGVGDAICWRDITHDAVGFVPPFEYMAQLPIIHSAEALKYFRAHLSALHGDWEEYLSDVPAFSEFNAAAAHAHRFYPDLYDWCRAGADDGYPRPLKQYWSRTGVTPEIEAEMHNHLTQ